MASAMGLPVGRVVRAMLQSTSRALVLALAWARVPAWACRMEDREAGRACGQGRLVSGIGSFSGAGFLEEVAAHLLLAENYN